MRTLKLSADIGLKNPRFRVDFSQIRDYFQLSGVLPRLHALIVLCAARMQVSPKTRYRRKVPINVGSGFLGGNERRISTRWQCPGGEKVDDGKDQSLHFHAGSAAGSLQGCVADAPRNNRDDHHGVYHGVFGSDLLFGC